MCIDLHTHSSYSDGNLSPKELVAMALVRRLKALALTDHDTVAGVPELLRYGQEAGLTVISGVEISTTLREHTVHILGYGIDPHHSELHTKLRPVQQGRSERNRAILAKLDDLGIHISAEELQDISRHGQTGRPHFAQLLVARGVVPSVDAAFDQYLGHGKAAWVPRFSYTAAETIDIIHQSGGKAVLAHPGVLSPDHEVVLRLSVELVEAGIDGIEVWYPSHGRQLRRTLLEFAQNHGLLATGGSDFHGAVRSNRPMAGWKSNFCPPCRLLPPLLAALGL